MDESPAALAARWGRVPAHVERLTSEADETYRVTFDDAGRAILKIAVAGTDAGDLDFEAALVEAALAEDPSLPLARTVATPLGETRVRTRDRWARVVECLPGEDAGATNIDLMFVRTIGRTAGRLSRALTGFRHPADHRTVEWDLRRAPALRGRLGRIDDPALRAVLEGVLDDLESALPGLAGLPAQVVHNDLNGGNVLIDEGLVMGIVDFGDAVFAPRVCDVGIALSYTLGYTAESQAWAAPAAFLAGYREVVDLTADELAVLPLLARARAAQRVLMSVGDEASIAPVGGRDDAARMRRAADDLTRLMAGDERGITA